MKVSAAQEAEGVARVVINLCIGERRARNQSAANDETYAGLILRLGLLDPVQDQRDASTQESAAHGRDTVSPPPQRLLSG